MASDTFWSTQGGTNRPVLQLDPPTTPPPNPLELIPGTEQGAIPAGYTLAAQAVNPRFPTVLTTTPTFTTNLPVPNPALDINRFTEWNSAYQVAYLLQQPTRTHQVSVGGVVVAHYVLTRNNTVPVNILNMTLSDYAMLSTADKLALGPTLRTLTLPGRPDLTIAASLGLTNDKAATNSVLSSLVTTINAATNMGNDRFLFSQQIEILQRQVAASDMIVPEKVVTAAREIETRFNRAKAFKDTLPPVNMQRINFNVENNDHYGDLFGMQAQIRAVSSDNNSTINRGYTEFIRAERTILTMQNRREAIARDTGLRDPKLDVANLIYQLQLLYEAEAEGIADSGTEEIKQLHKYLQDIGIMQRLVNETLKAYNPEEQDEKRRFMNLGGRPDGGVQTNQRSDPLGGQDVRIVFYWPGGEQLSPGGKGGSEDNRYEESPGYHWFHLQASGLSGVMDSEANNPGQAVTVRFSRNGDSNAGIQNGGLSAEEMRIFSMFSDDAWARRSDTRQRHPIDVIFGLDARPKQRFTDESEEGEGSLALYRKTTWDSFATQLNDFVTQLNQQNQIKQNEIESATRRQNRHFELGNNALRKMNDMLMTIGRM